MEHFLIDGSYAKLLAACHIDAAEVLRRAQLPGDLLARKAIRLTEAEYYRFLAAIGESSEEKDLAVRMATSEQIKTFSPPIFAAYCSKDGRTCIARLAAYKRLIGPMRYAIEETADACTVTLRPGDAALAIPAFLAEAEAAFLIALLRAATKEPIRPLRLTLATPPRSPALTELAGVSVTVRRQTASPSPRATSRTPSSPTTTPCGATSSRSWAVVWPSSRQTSRLPRG